MERRIMWVLFCAIFAVSSEAVVPVRVGVILDMETLVGKMCWISVSMAVEDFYESNRNYTTRLVLRLKDGKSDVLGAGSAGLGLINKDGVVAILGPQKSGQARFLSDIAEIAQVPLISSTATSPLLSSSSKPYFVRTALNDVSQVEAIASIVVSMGWREATIIYEDTDYGNGVVPFLIDGLQASSIRVPHRTVIPLIATDDEITKHLLNLQMLQTRVFIVHMSLPLGARLFSKAKTAGMVAKGYAWIMTDGIASLVESLDQEVISTMQGFVGVKPYVAKTAKLESFTLRWKQKYSSEYPEAERIDPSIFSLWAYDSVTALALAVEKVKSKSFTFRKPKIVENSTNLDALVVSNSGPEILEGVKGTSFEGLGGEFGLVSGQLNSSAYQIVNVVGNGHKGVGFWTPKYGLSPQLGTPERKNELGAIVWPGDTISVPRGWEVARGGRRLRVGFPVKDSFLEFVKYEENPITKVRVPEGYCIEIFDKVMNSLPYSVPFDYIPMKRNGTSVSYDQLVQEVHQDKYDAIAGDVTIMADRFQYVDFTLPYTGSGVYMIVPLREDNKRGSLLLFMKPLTMELWLCSLCFFLFTGFTVWGIERMEDNEDFKGPPREIISNVLYFSFSTLVFAHRQEIRSSYSKAVVIVWVFAVLILTSTYTASLASILTAAKLKPAFSDVNEVVKTGKTVGYGKGSFLAKLLKPTFGSNLVPLAGVDEYASALANGTVIAVFHELPYIRIFLKEHCKGYAMVGPTHRTAGLGFAFRKDSPLISDVSRAVVTVTQSTLMDDIEKRWMLASDTSQCPQPDDSGNRITLHSLRGLFMLTGIISSLALLATFIRSLFLGKPKAPQTASLSQKLEERERAIDELHEVDVELLPIQSRRKDGRNVQDLTAGPSTEETFAHGQGH